MEWWAMKEDQLTIILENPYWLSLWDQNLFKKPAELQREMEKIFCHTKNGNIFFSCQLENGIYAIWNDVMMLS